MKKIALLIDRNEILSYEEKEFYRDITTQKIKDIVDEIYFINSTLERSLPYTNLKDLFTYFVKNFKDDIVILMNAYSPLIDIITTKEMIKDHIDYVFDYTYPENIPNGLLPEIFNVSMLEFLIPLIPDNFPLIKNSLREIIEGEISSYDCNIFLTDSELSKYRVDFIPDSMNSLYIIKNIIEKHSYNLSLKKLEEIISADPLILRQRPTYYEIEITTEREKGEIFPADKLKRNGFIKIEDLKFILDEIKKFSYNPVVSLGLFGDFFLHPDLDKVIELLSFYPELSFLIESKALYIDKEKIDRVLQLDNVKLIFDISFVDNDKFKKYKTPLNEVIPAQDLSFIEKEIKSLDNKEKIYIQFTRTNLNEEELTKFYEVWKDFSDRIIIKKIDTFCGMLDKYRVVDLSPVKRFFCYHLKNDMVIFFNGDVPLCRQDFNGEVILGNIKKDGIKSCWEEEGKYFILHFNGIYEPKNKCEKCDEWWIFNF